MNKGRVGEDRGSKETDGCPLTDPFTVEACIRHGAYHLMLPPHFQHLHPIFPVVKLSITLPDLIPGH
jgi:hypothetical protein